MAYQFCVQNPLFDVDLSDLLLAELSRKTSNTNRTTTSHRSSPKKYQNILIDIYVNESQYQIVADLPGFRKDQVSVAFEADTRTLVISAKKEGEEPSKDLGYITRERYDSDEMTRKIKLATDAEGNSASGSLVDGVLYITIPKIQPKVIPIQFTTTRPTDQVVTKALEDRNINQ